MLFGESYGDPCARCGTTAIIIHPLAAAGRCAVCSPEVHAWHRRRAEEQRRLQLAALLAADALEAAVAARRRSQRHRARMEKVRRLIGRPILPGIVVAARAASAARASEA